MTELSRVAHDDATLIRLGRDALATEAAAIVAVSDRLGADFVSACRVCLSARGRVVVIGMGKSGHVGRKIAATLASTGTPLPIASKSLILTPDPFTCGTSDQDHPCHKGSAFSTNPRKSKNPNTAAAVRRSSGTPLPKTSIRPPNPAA